MENQELINVKKNNDNTPIYKAVRAVGLVKPIFDEIKQGFRPPMLQVIGTAFLLKNYRVMITCGHVVSDFINLPTEVSGMLVIGREGRYAPVKIDILDFAHDLAILKPIKTPNLTDEQFKMVLDREFSSGLEIADQYYRASTKIAYAGYPLGTKLLNQKHDPTYATGVVGVEICNTHNRKEVRITGPIVGGFSGAPIVLEDDPAKVLGIISNSPNKEAGDANIFMAISWEHIRALAELSNS
jgi:hypothetical protein